MEQAPMPRESELPSADRTLRERDEFARKPTMGTITRRATWLGKPPHVKRDGKPAPAELTPPESPPWAIPKRDPAVDRVPNKILPVG